jgi:hypothetical protein
MMTLKLTAYYDRSYSCLGGRLSDWSPTQSVQSAKWPFIYDGLSYLDHT